MSCAKPCNKSSAWDREDTWVTTSETVGRGYVVQSKKELALVGLIGHF